MADVIGGVINLSWMGGMLNIVLWSALICIAVLILGGLIFWLVVIMTNNKIVEVSSVTRKIKNFAGREKKNHNKQVMLWVGGGLRKWLPKLQQKDVFLSGKRETVFLMKDNNGLHHTLRLPNEDELRLWYYNVYGIEVDKLKDKPNLNEIEKKVMKEFDTLFWLPNPSEDVNWLKQQVIEAKSTFATGLLKHPMMVWLGTLALLVFMTIIWLIIMKRL